MNKIAKQWMLAINLIFMPWAMLSCQEKTTYQELLSYAPHLNPWQNLPKVPKLLVGVFVDANSQAGAQADGRSWATAYNRINQAIDDAKNGSRIYVAAGTYMYPAVRITDKQGLELIGGYKAGELYEKSRAHLKIDEWAVLSGSGMSGGMVEITNTASDIHFNGGFVFRGGSVSPAIYINGTAALLISGITISDNRFENNTGVGLGAGISIEHAKDIHLNRLDASGNDAHGGGFIYANQVSGLTISGGTWKNNHANHSGGALFVTASSGINISGQEIKNNQANNGGGIYISNCKTDEISLDRIKFSDNESGARGGGMAISLSDNLKLSNLEFANNKLTILGAGIHISKSTNVQLLSSTFTGNQASVMGGAIYATKLRGNIVFDDLTIRNNYANNAGGLALREVEAHADATISHSRFIDNSAAGAGGAFLANQIGSQLKFLTTTFEKNNSNHMGGAILLYIDSDQAKVIIGEDVQFIGNNSKALNGGGAIRVVFADGNNPRKVAGVIEPPLVFQNQSSDIVDNVAQNKGHFLSVGFHTNPSMTPYASAFIDQFIATGSLGIDIHDALSTKVHID